MKHIVTYLLLSCVCLLTGFSSGIRATVSAVPDTIFSGSDLGIASSISSVSSMFQFPCQGSWPKKKARRYSSIESKQDIFGYSTTKLSTLFQIKGLSVGVGALLAETGGIYLVDDPDSPRPSASGTGSDAYQDFRAMAEVYLSRQFSFGVQGKFFQRQLLDESGSSFSVGSGINWWFNKDFSLGLFVNNLYSSGLEWPNGTDELPMQIIGSLKLNNEYGTFHVVSDFERHRMDTSHHIHDQIELGSKIILQPDASGNLFGFNSVVSLNPFRLIYSKDFLTLGAETVSQDTVGLVLRY